MMRARRDFGETAFMVFILLMMIIGGLSSGYPGLALFGGIVLALLVIGIALQFVGPIGPKLSSLPRPVLILLGIPVGAVALYMFTAGDGDMRLWGVLLGVGWIGLIVASFLPDVEQKLEIKLPGVRIEGEQAEALARVMGLELPDPSGLEPGERRERTIVKEIEIRPGDMGSVEEAVTRIVLGAHGVRVRQDAGTGGSLSRVRELLAAGGAEAALAELEAILGGGSTQDGARELRGEALVALGRYEDALVDLAAIPPGPGAAGAWFARGEACRHLGRDEEAATAYEQAAAYALTEDAGSDRAVLPLALERMGNTDGATRALGERLAGNPDHGGLLCVRALLAARAGSTGDALDALERAVSTHPGQVLRTLDGPALADVASEARGQDLRSRAEREREQQIARLRSAHSG
jgi:Flp pilus assembly protein TadD